MSISFFEVPGATIAEVQPDNPRIDTPRAVNDIIGEAFSRRANAVILPESVLDSAFFALRTGLAGEILEKFANYGLRVAITGDISRYLAESEALRNFVGGADHDGQVFFVPDAEAARTALRKALGA
jgi:hypothetical protein